MPAQEKANRGPSAGPENRRALIAAAREVFSTQGYRAPLSAVAKKAGVGQGSLYRHFPDRVDLAVAVFDENLTELEGLAAQPSASLEILIQRVIDQAVRSTAFFDLITVDLHDERVLHLSDRMREVAVILLAHEKAAGRIAPSISADDVLLAVSMLAGVVARADDERRHDVAERGWELLRQSFVNSP